MSSFPPGYSEDGDCGPEGYVTEDRAEELFLAGAQAMREFIARHLIGVPSDDKHCADLAAFARTIWLESWGKDPGHITKIPLTCWEA